MILRRYCFDLFVWNCIVCLEKSEIGIENYLYGESFEFSWWLSCLS